MKAHLIKYTPQGIQCSAEDCLRNAEGDDSGEPVVGWDELSYGNVVAAALHGFLLTAGGQYDDKVLDKDELNKAFYGAAQMAEWADIKPQDVQLPRRWGGKLRRAMAAREERT